MEAIRLYPKETAVIIRKVLKKAFPACKFSVVTERGSMVSSVSISWTDGPTVRAVDAVVSQFKCGSFDGMIDSFDYKTGADRFIVVDGQKYETACQYISTDRQISAELANRCIKQIANYWGGVEEIPVAVQGSFGRYTLPAGNQAIRKDVPLTWYDAIHRAASDRTTYTRSDVG